MKLSNPVPTPLYLGAFTWANRPAAATSPVGAEITITDMPSGGRSRLYNDGAYWKLFTPLKLGGTGAAASAHTGTLTETTIVTFTVPGVAMTPTGILTVATQWTFNATANSKIARVKFGGTTLGQVDTGSSNTYGGMEVRIKNRNVQNAQIGNPINGFSQFFFGVNSQQTATIDSSADVSVTITADLSDTGDSMTLESWDAVLMN